MKRSLFALLTVVLVGGLITGLGSNLSGTLNTANTESQSSILEICQDPRYTPSNTSGTLNTRNVEDQSSFPEIRQDPRNTPSSTSGTLNTTDAESQNTSGTLNTTDAESQSSVSEIHHVFFLKVHKAASSTVQNIMFRFALSHGLTVMLPHKGHILSEKRVNWLPKAMYPPSGERYFDILCNHVIFNEKSVRVRLHADTVFIGIVRHPFDQFVSSFNYYRNVLHFHILMNISGDDPVSTYLSNPKIWEPKEPRLSRTHNRMSIDFGMEPVRMKSAIYVNRYLDYLDRKFHLVLVSERFDESMILMKRHLGWKLKDVLYMKQNVHGSKPQGYTDTQRAAHKLFNMADYALYEHFSGLFDKRVAAQGAAFGEEVKTYVSVRNSVEKFCLANDTTMESLRVAASLWSEEFWVSKTDCSFMKLEEVPFVMTLRSRLYQNEIN